MGIYVFTKYDIYVIFYIFAITTAKIFSVWSVKIFYIEQK